MNNPGNSELYPLKFIPIYHAKMWGGDQMQRKLHRQLPQLEQPIGEAWEIVDRDDAQSIVAEGPLAGTAIRELMARYGKAFVGSKATTERFPLLIKIIDAGQRLSLQVHPDAAACAAIGDGAEPKTEMWYIIAVEKDAKIIAGLSPRTTQCQFLENLTSADIEQHLQVFPAIPGDAYFIQAGTIHAIGAGNLLLEIQQNSDTTYRVSDWGRVDANGKSRELHVDKAIKAINFTNRISPRISGVSDTSDRNRKYPVINHCPHFLVDDLRLVEEFPDTTAPGTTFHLITAINHRLQVGNQDSYTRLLPGESCLIPACFGSYTILPLDNVESTVIKTVLQ